VANVQRALGNLPAAIAAFERALALDPGKIDVHWNLATCFLLQGDYQRGWDKYAWRERAGAVFLDRFPQPRWDGSSLAGKTLLVHAEQGIGDEILFATCYRELIAQAQRLIIVCEPRLVALFRRSFPEATVHGHARVSTWDPLPVSERVDYQISAGSVPAFLRRDAASFPRQKQLLIPDETQVARWKERLDALGTGLKVGISWRAGGRVSERRRRTTDFEAWSGLFQLPGVQWINLQYGDADEEISEARERYGITIHDLPGADPLLDQDAFAAKISALDLVISVGNATAHMAGAVGKAAWVLLPFVPGWRWQIAGETSPWYESVWLLRQQQLGDWTVPFRRATDALQALLKQRGIATAADGASLPRMMVPQCRGILEPTLTSTDHSQLDAVRDDRLLLEVAIPQVLSQAIADHQAGRLAAAEAAYRQILRRAPRHPDATHLLGVIAHQTGRMDLALQTLQRAVALAPLAHLPLFNHGNVLLDLQQYEEAAACFQRALQLEHHFDAAAINLATALRRSGRTDEGIAFLQAYVRSNPEAADVYLELGSTLRGAMRADEAMECYETVIGIHPTIVKPYLMLAQLLLEDGRGDEALAFCHQALALEPKSSEAHHECGLILHSLGRGPEAMERLQRALELEPDRFDTLFAMAQLLLAEGDGAAAEVCLRRAAALQPTLPHVYNALGQALEQQCRWHDAIAAYDQAISLDSQFALAHCNSALARLRIGDYRHGWAKYAWRWRCPAGPRSRDFFMQPLWQGECLENKTLLIHGEQGLGDEILFANYFPQVIDQAKRCVIACDRRLVALFARSFPAASVIGMWRGREHLLQLPVGVIADLQIPAGSVPGCLAPADCAPRAKSGWLLPDEQKVAAWRERLATLGGTFKLGISWSGGNTQRDRRSRGTELAQWRQLLEIPGIDVISLQHGEARQDLAEFQASTGVRIHQWTDLDPKVQVDDLAAQIAALDLVISVGNTNIHLAGALGTPAWALIPGHADWCWGYSGEESNWYASVRLIRQEQPGRWDSCFRKIFSDLSNLLASSGR